MFTPTQPLGDALRDAVRAEIERVLHAETPSELVVPYMAGDALAGISAVSGLTDLSNAQIWRMVAAGTFPRPVRPSEKRCAWLLSEIMAWIIDRKAERDRYGADIRTVGAKSVAA